MSRFILIIATALFLLPPTASPAAADGVTVYRCRAANGQLTLRDSPCAKGQRQESVDTMIRPRDPARPATIRPTVVQGAREPAEPVRYVIQPAARPVYECTTADGSRYTSETADGNPRWVPIWTGGYGYGGLQPPMIVGGVGGGVHYRDRHTEIRIGGGQQVIAPFPGSPPLYPAPVVPYPPNAYSNPGLIQGGGAWVRDTCVALPPERACSIMAARRDDLQRRNVMRQASEAEALDREQAALAARLRNECGSR